jgi:TRAP-type mannitol/chloroaromatic compound transport system substrate-binding protein
MKKLQRRDFLKNTSLAAAAVAAGSLAACNTNKKNEGPAIIEGKTYEWKMVTTWPPHFPILGEYAEEMAKWIDVMSGGRMKIQVYGGGELVPALEIFDAVSQGVAEMGHGAAYYWAGKSQASQFFCSVPFGMNTHQFNAWLYDGGGIELWDELYAKFNLKGFPCGNTGGQMGGWFNKEINSVADLKGLKIRMPGLGGKVMTKAGASAVLSPAGELYTNLERGVIDALEWIGPYHDYLMGFHDIAKYYYYPGWHEPTATLELMVNKKAFDDLPDYLKKIIETCCAATNMRIHAAFEAKNTEYYFKIKDEVKRVQIRKFPNDVIDTLQRLTSEVINEIAASDAVSRKAYDSYSRFMKGIGEYTEISERNYSAGVQV